VTALVVDRTAIETFVSALFRYADEGGVCQLRAFRDDINDTWRPDLWRAIKLNGTGFGPLIDAAAQLAQQCADATERVVFAPPVVCLNSETKAAEKNIANGLVVVVECDKNPSAARAFLEGLLGPPTLIVASGGTWTDPISGEVEARLHLYWRLQEPTREFRDHQLLKMARELAQRLVGADHTAVSLIHPLRWPGSWHRKAEPRLASIVTLNEGAEIDLADALERLREAVAARGEDTSEADYRNHKPNDEPQANFFDIASALSVIPNDAEDWVVWNDKVALSCWAASGGSEGGFHAFNEWSKKSSKYAVDKHGKPQDGYAKTRARWDHISKHPPNRCGFGSLHFLARQACPSWSKPSLTFRPPGPHPAQALIDAAAPLIGNGDANGGDANDEDTNGDDDDDDDDDASQEAAFAARAWAAPQPRGFARTEDGIALAFAARFKEQLRYCHHTGAWFRWVSTHWKREETKLAFAWARQVCREFTEGAQGRVKATLAKAATAAAVERFAQADRAFAVTSETWDRDPMLLGTPAGVVDLQTGKIWKAEQEAYITKLTAVAPAATAACPLWLKFLGETTGGDNELIRFLQQWTGYCLTGDTREHALVFAWGPGGNGKSVWLNTIVGILADYAKNAAMDTFVSSANDRHPTDLAMLKGARMVCASETEEGRAWAEVRIKQLTGGDTITARFMRQDFFEYRPQFKLTVIGNHKPALRNVDDAARRRFNVVPFTHKPDVPDRQLEEKLKAEWPGILRWMIEGCLDWQENGLIRSQSVMDATATYFSEQDLLRQWLDECCDSGPTKSDTLAALFKSWTDYALVNGEKPRTTTWFTPVMQGLGFESVKHTPGQNSKRGFTGVGLKPVDTSDQYQNKTEG
jgi:P4 family phage/plasmid primase-like protien